MRPLHAANVASKSGRHSKITVDMGVECTSLKSSFDSHHLDLLAAIETSYAMKLKLIWDTIRLTISIS